MRTHRTIVGLAVASMAAIAVVAGAFVLYSDETDPVVVRAKARGEAVIAEYEERFASREDRRTTGSQRDPETLPPESTDAVYSAPELCAQLASILRDMEGQAHYEQLCVNRAVRDWTEEELDFLASFFQRHAALMDSIRELASLREPFHLADAFSEEHPEKVYWLPLVDMARLLAVEMAVHVRKGSVEHAVDNCLAILALSQSLSEEPWFFSQGVSRSVFGRAFWGVETFLQPGELTPDQTQRIVRELETSYGKEGFIRSLETEAAWLIAETEAYCEMTKDFTPGSISRAIMGAAYRSPIVGGVILSRDRRHFAMFMGRITEAARLPYYEAYPQLEKIQDEIDELWFTNVLTLFGASTNAKAPGDHASHEACVDLMRLGLLLESHYSENGTYPETLDVLAPEFGGAVPLDPFSGNAYVYRPADDTFLLYSIGRNREDNGGLRIFMGGDIVWRPVED